MRILTELRINTNREETILDKCVNKFLSGDTEIIIKEGWIMLEELRERYATKLQELEAQDIEVLVKDRLAEVEADIRAEVLAKHNDEVLLAKLKVQAVDEMLADQVAEPNKEVENLMEV